MQSDSKAERVGLMTGDATIASDAPVVVMTLEILLSMLYKQTTVQGWTS